MAKTLLQLVQSAAQQMGIVSPTYVVGNQASDVVQLLALINDVGDELQREFDWEALKKEYRFTTNYLSTTGSWTSGATTVTGIPSTATLAANTWMASGTGINQDTYIQSVDTANQVTLSQTVNSTQSSAAIVFGQTKYAMPSDFDRQVDRTHYDKSKRWEMAGPATSQEWQFLKSSYISTGPRLRYRIMGGYFQIWPMSVTPELLGFEYLSGYWASNGGTPKSSFTLDTDTCVFPDRLMVIALKKKYFEIKGFDPSAFTRDYQRELSIAKANDAGAATLTMGQRTGSVLVGYENIPDSGYGL